MYAKLSDTDRRTVDLLLAGDGAADEALSPAMLERVNHVRKLLGLLAAMPAEEPSNGLTEATLRRVTALQAQSQDGQSPSAPAPM